MVIYRTLMLIDPFNTYADFETDFYHTSLFGIAGL